MTLEKQILKYVEENVGVYPEALLERFVVTEDDVVEAVKNLLQSGLLKGVNRVLTLATHKEKASAP